MGGEGGADYHAADRHQRRQQRYAQGGIANASGEHTTQHTTKGNKRRAAKPPNSEATALFRAPAKREAGQSHPTSHLTSLPDRTYLLDPLRGALFDEEGR